MKFSHPNADIFVPNGTDPATALARTTHLCVLAHQDDIEINAYPAVAECFGRDDRHLTGVIVTDGAGSSRSGPYANYTDEEIKAVLTQAPPSKPRTTTPYAPIYTGFFKPAAHKSSTSTNRSISTTRMSPLFCAHSKRSACYRAKHAHRVSSA